MWPSGVRGGNRRRLGVKRRPVYLAEPSATNPRERPRLKAAVTRSVSEGSKLLPRSRFGFP
jgi:hypothetical protein